MKHILLAASLLLTGCRADMTTVRGHQLQCFRLTQQLIPTVYRCINEEVLCYMYEGGGIQCEFHYGLLTEGEIP